MLTSVPTGSRVIRISSPAASVNASGGTMPVPVIRKQPCGKTVVAKQPLGQRRQRALDLTDRRLAAEDRRAAAVDRDRNRRVRPGQRAVDDQTRAEGRAAGVDLRLRQIERVLAFDVARAHVVADRVAEDRAARVDRQRQLRLGHVPLRIGADPHRSARADDAVRRRLEEQLRPVRVVDAVVEAAAARVLRLLHARRAAAEYVTPAAQTSCERSGGREGSGACVREPRSKSCVASPYGSSARKIRSMAAKSERPANAPARSRVRPILWRRGESTWLLAGFEVVPSQAVWPGAVGDIHACAIGSRINPRSRRGQIPDAAPGCEISAQARLPAAGCSDEIRRSYVE